MPAWGNFILDKGRKAGGVILARRFVKLSAEETVIQCTAATDVAEGVATIPVTSAEQATGKRTTVRLAGVAEVEAGGAIAIGALVASDSSGRAVAAATGNRIQGQAEGVASGAGDYIAVRLMTPSGSLLP